MRRLLLLTLFLILSTFSIKGQIQILGTIVNEQSSPIAYANVVLLNAKDSSFIAGAVTDDNGAFNIKCTIVNGILRVSAIGYETLFIDSCKGNIGTVRLRIDNQNLDEVVVKGYRQIVRHEHEKTIFNVSQMPKIEAMTAIDAMKFAPGVFVTSSGGISVLGKNAVVFVNDRRLTEDEQSAYLRNLRASDIERIEVMHNNGGDKDADIQGGVINIVTRQDRLGSDCNVDYCASSPKIHYYDYAPTANLFFGTTKWNVYGSYSYTQNRSGQYNETCNDYVLSSTAHLSKGNYISHEKSHNYRFGAIYNLLKHHSLGMEINGTSASPTTDRGNYDAIYNTRDKSYLGNVSQTYRSHSDFYNLVGSYRWDIDDNNSYLKFLINYNNKNSKSDNGLKAIYKELTDNDINENDKTLSDGDNISTTLDFRKNAAKGWGFRARAKILSSNRRSDYSSMNNLSGRLALTEWDYKEKIYGGHVGTSKEVGKFYFNASLRIESTNMDGKINGGSRTTKSYVNWFPYFYVSYSTKHKYDYSLEYSRSIYRPAFSLMNGYVNRVSDVLYDKGNPYLEAELSDMINFTVSHANNSVSLVYNHKPKAITEWFNVADGITYHTNVNFGTISSLAVKYSYSGNFCRWWQTNIYLSGCYTHIPKSYNKDHLLNGIIYWNNRMYWERIGALTLGYYFTSPTITVIHIKREYHHWMSPSNVLSLRMLLLWGLEQTIYLTAQESAL